MERSAGPVLGALLLASAVIVVGAGPDVTASMPLATATGMLVAAGLSFVLVGNDGIRRPSGRRLDGATFEGVGRLAIGLGLLTVAATLAADPGALTEIDGAGPATASVNALGATSGPSPGSTILLLFVGGFGLAGCCGVAMGVGMFLRPVLASSADDANR